MPDLPESQEPSPAQGSDAPDFNQELKNAQASGDFDFVLDTAKKSHRMLTDFEDAIKRASYAGKDAAAIAMGLQFLANMIANSAGQVAALKQAEKQTQAAMREAAKKAKENPGVPIGVVQPDAPEVTGNGSDPKGVSNA